jgi:hypothetical protein
MRSSASDGGRADEAVQAFSSIESPPPREIHADIVRLLDFRASAAVRDLALAAFRRLKPSAKGHMTKILFGVLVGIEEKSPAAPQAAAALGEMPSLPVSMTLELLKHTNSEIRAAAITAFGRLTAEGRAGSVEELLPRLIASTPAERDGALGAFLHLEAEDRVARAEELLSLMETHGLDGDRVREVTQAAQSVVGSLAVGGLAPRITSLLAHSDRDVRELGAAAFAQLDEAARVAQAASLLQIITDEQNERAVQAASLLSTSSGIATAHTTAVVSLLEHASEKVRAAASATLAEQAGTLAATVAAVERGSEAFVFEEALKAALRQLGKIAVPAATATAKAGGDASSSAGAAGGWVAVEHGEWRERLAAEGDTSWDGPHGDGAWDAHVRTRVDCLAMVPPAAFHASAIPEEWREKLGPFWAMLAPSGAEALAAERELRQVKVVEAVDRRSSHAVETFERPEVRWDGSFGASHMVGGTVDVVAAEAAREVTLQRALAVCASYEVAETRFNPPSSSGHHDLPPVASGWQCSHLCGGTVDVEAVEAARRAAVEGALAAARSFEEADAAKGEAASFIDWAKVTDEALAQLGRDAKEGFEFSHASDGEEDED